MPPTSRLSTNVHCRSHRKTGNLDRAPREKRGKALASSKQRKPGDRREKFIAVPGGEQKVLADEFLGIELPRKRVDVAKLLGEGPEQAFLEVVFGRSKKRNVLVGERPYLIEPSRKLVASHFPLLRAKSHIEAAVSGAERLSPCVDIDGDNRFPLSNAMQSISGTSAGLSPRGRCEQVRPALHPDC